jgi:DNA-binding beta-propeller fold protein YncE
MAETVGSGEYTYAVDASWGRGPGGRELGLVSGLAVDAQDRVYVFQRTPEPCVLVFDRDGRHLRAWGAGAFRTPHGIWIGPADEAYCTDTEAHTVTRWTLDGRLLATRGTDGQPGAPGMPFNQPAQAIVAPDGAMYVADGYGQHRVHRFGADGRLERSWGTPGTGPGEFGWPVHSVRVDPRGRVLVADRGNNRVQLFSPSGEYLGQWRDLRTPMDIWIDPVGNVIVVEGGQRVTVLTLDGAPVAQWGEQGTAPGQFANAPHCLCVDSRGDLYVGEVGADNRLQKFIRR